MPTNQTGLGTLSKGKDIQTAQLQWDDLGQPQSDQFHDVYFSRDNGLAETEYVFLRHNRLAQRFGQVTLDKPFVIAETGFGSGLNFLCAWQLWQKTARQGAQLHFISVEKHPLTHADLTRVLALWPQLQPLAQQLIKHYPLALCHGIHRLDFGSVSLTLILDDAANGLNQLLASHHPHFARGFAQFHVDAWFLDGFAPAKNPMMWRQELFDAMAQLSQNDTTVATFTSAGVVKRGLEAAGFTIAKVPGYGRKREMIRATRARDSKVTPKAQYRAPTAWSVDQNPSRKPPPIQSVAVIGAGLAGAHSAFALAQKGLEITVFDRHSRPAAEASGNPQGVVYAKLSPHAGNQGDFNSLALLYAQRRYQPLWQGPNAIGGQCGVLQLGHHSQTNSHSQLHCQAIVDRLGDQGWVEYLTQEQASERAGTTVTKPGLFFPQSGWLPPAEVCDRLLSPDNIHFKPQTAVQSMHYQNGRWWLCAADGSVLGDFCAVVVANANEARSLDQTAHLPLKPVRGQVTLVPASQTSAQLQVVVCSDGYIAPPAGTIHCLGATFDPHSESLTPKAQDQRDNIVHAVSALPELHPPWQDSPHDDWGSRVGLRATTPDYLPMVGPVADPEAMDQIFAPLRRNAQKPIDQAGSYQPRLFANLGHGSRGLTYTPICASLLAAYLVGEPPPLPMTLHHALHPARFLIRDLMRNRR